MNSATYTSDPWFPSQENAFTLFFAITYNCNKKCKHCFTESDNNISSSIDDKYWLNLIDQLSELNNPRLFFTGGEPLKHPSLLNLASYANKKSIPIILGTNATLITSEIANDLKNVGVCEARVSIDGATEYSHDLLRGKGAFFETVNGIKLLINSGITVSIRTTITKQNYSQLTDIAKLVNELNIVDWELKHIIPTGRAAYHPELLTTSEERDFALRTILEIINSNIYPNLKIKLMEGTINQHTIIPESIKVAACPAGTRMMVVQPSGDVIPCGYLSSCVIGNITQESLHSILNKWDKIINNEDFFIFPDECKTCEHFSRCKGGCRAYNFCQQ